MISVEPLLNVGFYIVNGRVRPSTYNNTNDGVGASSLSLGRACAIYNHVTMGLPLAVDYYYAIASASSLIPGYEARVPVSKKMLPVWIFD